MLTRVVLLNCDMKANWLVVGISGVTCGGKTTLAQRLHANIPGSRLIFQDDYFYPQDSEKHRYIPELDHFNWDCLESLDMDKLVKDVRKYTNTIAEKDSLDVKGDDRRKVLIVEGILVFNRSELTDLCDLRYYLTLTRDQCWARRQMRIYDPPDPPGYFQQCTWPMYAEHREQVKNSVDRVTYIDGTVNANTTYGHVFKEVMDKARI